MTYLAQGKNETYIDLENKHGIHENAVGGCVDVLVMFGGRNFVHQISDTWILDLSWKDMNFPEIKGGFTGDRSEYVLFLNLYPVYIVTNGC